MKLRSIGSLLGLGLLSCSSGGSDGDSPVFVLVPRWNNQHRVPTASHLRAVRFNNASQGFVAGFDSSIYRTDDGGITWRQEEHQPFNRGGHILGFDFLGSELHAVGSAVENGLGRYWTSGDALNWSTPDADGAGRPFVSVDVTQSPTGGRPFISWYLRDDWRIAIAQGGTPVDSVTIFNVTVDNPTPPSGNTATAIDMLFDGPGYVVGHDGRIFETTNFANSWTDRTIAPATTRDMLDVQTQGPGIVFVCGQEGTLYWTENGGAVASLDGTNRPAVGPATADFRGVFFIHTYEDESVGWVVGEGGAIYKITGTAVAGPTPVAWNWTWTAQNSNTGVDLYDVVFVDANNGYAVGNDGVVVKTTNGGTTWTVITGGTLDTFNAVSFTPDGQVGVAVGDNGRVVRTVNGGASWTPFTNNPPNVRYTGVSIPAGGSRNIVYVCGEGGIVRRHRDLLGGTGNWEAPTIAVPNVAYRAIHFPLSDDVGFVAGDSGTLLFTNNGSSTLAWSWTAVAHGVAATQSFRAIASGISGNDIGLFAGGTGGNLVESTMSAYATPWTPVAGQRAADITGIQAAPNIVFTSINHAAGLQRRLAGILWEDASQPGAPVATGIAFPSASLGWYVSDKIYYTENGASPMGASDWKPSYAHTTAALKAIWMNPTGTVGYAVGERGTILKTVTGGK